MAHRALIWESGDKAKAGEAKETTEEKTEEKKEDEGTDAVEALQAEEEEHGGRPSCRRHLGMDCCCTKDRN